MFKLQNFALFIVVLANLVESDSLHSSQVIYGHHFTPNASTPNIELSVGPETGATKDVSHEGFEISNGSKGNNKSSFSNADPNTDSKVLRNSGNNEEKSKTSSTKSVVENTIEFLPNSTISFADIFPGLFVKVPLIVQNSFSKTIRIVSISSSDSRVIGVVSNTTLPPSQIVEIGYLAVDPARAPDINYMSIGSLDRTAVSEPLLKSELQLLKQRETLYNQLKLHSAHKLHGVVTIATDVKTEHSIAVYATLIRPSITMDSTIDFSLVQVGSVVSRTIKVYNPSDTALIIQVLPLLQTQESSVFKLIMAEFAQLEVIPPKTSKEVATIQFSPEEILEYSTSVYIKNNLTILDSVKISGQGGTGRLLIRAEKPTKTPNTFSFLVTKEDLKYCKQKPPLEVVESEGLLITQNFQATNLGNLPVDVLSLSIDDEPCEGYGFRVHNCYSFSLEPKQTHNISISYRPDFSASIVKNELRVATSSGPVSFSLVGVVPQQLLPLCSNSRPQTQFEGVLRILLILTFLSVFSLVAYVSVREYQFNGNKYLLKPIVFVSKDGLTLDIDDTSVGVSEELAKPKLAIKLPDNNMVVSELASTKAKKEREVEKEKAKEKEKEKELETEKDVMKPEPPIKKKETNTASKKVEVELQANHSLLSEKPPSHETAISDRAKEKSKKEKEKEKEKEREKEREREREIKEKEAKEMREREKAIREREAKEIRERELKEKEMKEKELRDKEQKELLLKATKEQKQHKEKEHKEEKDHPIKERELKKEKEHKETTSKSHKETKEARKEPSPQKERKEGPKELPKEPVKDKEPLKKYRSQSMDSSNAQRPKHITTVPSISQSHSTSSQEENKKPPKKEPKSLSRSDEKAVKKESEMKPGKQDAMEKPPQPRKEMDLITSSVAPAFKETHDQVSIKPILVKAAEEPRKQPEHNVKFQLENSESTDHLAPSIFDSPLTSDNRKKTNPGVIGSGKNKPEQARLWTRGLSLERLPSIPAPLALPTAPSSVPSARPPAPSFLFNPPTSTNSQPSLSFFSSNLQDTSSFFSAFQPTTSSSMGSSVFDGSYQLFNTSFQPPVKTESAPQPLVSQNQQVLDQQLQDSPFSFTNPFITK